MHEKIHDRRRSSRSGNNGHSRICGDPEKEGAVIGQRIVADLRISRTAARQPTPLPPTFFSNPDTSLLPYWPFSSWAVLQFSVNFSQLLLLSWPAA